MNKSRCGHARRTIQLGFLLAGLSWSIGDATAELTQPLQLAMTASPNPARPGDVIAYTMTVANRGMVDLTGVQLNVTVPDKLALFTVENRSYSSGDVVGWTLGTIGAGQSRTVTMQPRVPSGGFFDGGGTTPPDGTTLQNVATVTSSSGQSATDTETIMIDSTPVLRVQVEEDQDPVKPGGRLNYRLTFGNGTTVNATGVELRMRLPAGVTFVSASDGGTENDGEVRWSLGTVRAGQSGLRQLSVTVGAGIAGGTLLIGEASIQDAAQSQSTGRSRAVTTVQGSTPLAVTMTASPNPARPGEFVTYTLTVANRGPLDLIGVTLAATLPDKMSQNNIGNGSSRSDQTVSWTLGTLNAGQSRTVTMQLKVSTASFGGPPAPPDGTTLQNVAIVTSSSGQGATDTETIMIDETPVIRVQVEEDQDPVQPGGRLDYRLTFGNGTTVNATGVELRMRLPTGVTFVSASNGGTEDNGEVRWSLGTVSAGQSGLRQLSVTVGAGIAGGTLLIGEASIQDVAQLQSTGRARAITTVQVAPPLAVAMTASPNPARPGEIVTYTITVANRGTVDLSGVQLNVTVPDNLTLFTVENRSYSSGDVIGWTLGTVGAGQSRTVTMQPRVPGGGTFGGGTAPPDGTTLQSVATVTSSSGQSATDTAIIMIDETPVVRVQIEEDQDPVQPGGRLNYRLTFGNGTTVNATGVELRMRLPAGVAFVSASNGGTDNNNGEVRWSLGTVSTGQSGLRQLSVTVGTGVAAGTLLIGEAWIQDAAQPQSTGRSRAMTTVQVAPPLAVAMTASPNPARPGDIITYTLSVTNRGLVDLIGVTLAATLPDKVSTISVGNGVFGSGPTVTWTLGTLNAGQSRAVTMQLKVLTTSFGTFIGPPDGTTLQNAVTVTSSNGQNATCHLTVRIGSNWPEIDPPIPSQEIAEGRLLSFVVAANDADIPNQTVTFSLEPGAPAGASVDSKTGVFSWTPTRAQGPSTNSITVRVTDSSPQQLSATQTFTVVVTAPAGPKLLGSFLPNGEFELTLNGEIGRIYLIQASADLVVWEPVTNILSIAATTRIKDGPAASSRQRFYRALSP